MVQNSLFQALGSWDKRKRTRKETKEDLVLPYFLSRSPFFSLPTTESLEQARSRKDTVSRRGLLKDKFNK